MLGKEKEVSVDIILTTFNEDKSKLKRSINSIINQTFINWTLIIVFEPNDINEELLREYSEKFGKIRIFKNLKKMGFVKSLNIGISHSKSKYIARLDSDDECLPTRLAKQINFLENNSEVDILGSWITLDCSPRKIRKYPEFNNEIKKSFLLSNAIAHPSVMLRANIFKKYGSYNEYFKFSEDLELWLRYMSNGLKFHNIQETLLLYSIDRREKSREDRIFIFEARKLHNKKVFNLFSASISLILFWIISLLPNKLFSIIKRLFALKVGNIHEVKE